MKKFIFIVCLFISNLCMAQTDTLKNVSLDGYSFEADEILGITFAYSDKDCYVFSNSGEKPVLLTHALFPNPSEEKTYITRSLFQTGDRVSTQFEIHFKNHERWHTVKLGIFFRDKGKTYRIKIEPI